MIRRWLYSRKGERERGIRQIGTHIFLSQKFSSFFRIACHSKGGGGSLAEYEKKKKKGEGESKREREKGVIGAELGLEREEEKPPRRLCSLPTGSQNSETKI